MDCYWLKNRPIKKAPLQRSAAGPNYLENKVLELDDFQGLDIAIAKIGA